MTFMGSSQHRTRAPRQQHYAIPLMTRMCHSPPSHAATLLPGWIDPVRGKLNRAEMAGCEQSKDERAAREIDSEPTQSSTYQRHHQAPPPPPPSPARPLTLLVRLSPDLAGAPAAGASARLLPPLLLRPTGLAAAALPRPPGRPAPAREHRQGAAISVPCTQQAPLGCQAGGRWLIRALGAGAGR
jgi:hypothetical protein